MTHHITKVQAEALATFANRVRPDWDHPGILAAITKSITKGTALDLAHALLTLAEDDQLRSPAMLASDGRHWLRRDGRPTGPRLSNNVACPDHPDHDMPCRHSAHTGDMTREQIAQAKAAVLAVAEAARTQPVRRPVEPPPTVDLDAVRAQIDATKEPTDA